MSDRFTLEILDFMENVNKTSDRTMKNLVCIRELCDHVSLAHIFPHRSSTVTTPFGFTPIQESGQTCSGVRLIQSASPTSWEELLASSSQCQEKKNR